MESIIFLIIIVTLGTIFYLFRDKIYIFLQQEAEQLPYKKKDFLLNIPERNFFEKLQQIIPDNCVVFPQVLLSSIVSADCSPKEFWKYHNKINRKTIDFVIFEKQYLKPLLTIEYDGKTHNRPSRRKRDEFVNNVLKSSGIIILHIKHQKNINFEEIKNEIHLKLRE